MAWLRVDPLDLPACLQSRDFDCQVCTFFDPEQCTLRANGEYMEAERALLRRKTSVGEEREQWADVLAIELAAHGLSLHYTVLARIVRERYSQPSLSDMLVLRTLSRSPDYFEAEEPGVYGLTRVGRALARFAIDSGSSITGRSSRRRVRTALDFFFATTATGRGLPPAETNRLAWQVQEWRAVATAVGQNMPAFFPPPGGLQVLGKCEENLRQLVARLIPGLRAVSTTSLVSTLRAAAGRHHSLDDALMGAFGVQKNLLAMQISGESPDSAWLTSRALYRVVARVYRAWQAPAVDDVEVESPRGLIAQLTLSRDAVGADAALEAYMSALYRAGLEARDRLAVGNLRLVSHIAYRYTGHIIGLADAIGYGTFGLLTAAERFDPTRGFTFSTYAYQWIRQAITRSIADFGRAIRLPVHVVEFLAQVDRGERELAADLGCQPTLEELADYLQIESEQIESRRRADRVVLSLDDPSNAAVASIVDELVDDSEDADLQGQAERQDLETRLIRALDRLKRREGLILKQRVGLGEYERQTLEQIGNQLGLTRERIRQLEEKALKKLRGRSLRVELEGFVTPRPLSKSLAKAAADLKRIHVLKTMPEQDE